MDYSEKLLASQVRGYLDRLEITGKISVDLTNLNQLLFAQLTHIPFDSLDVWGAGICPSLALNDIYEKIVIKGRGGYCFELNTFFRSLLNAVGFDAYQVAACILNPDGSPQPPAHNAILCNLNSKKYFLDVGYGGPVPYEALELCEGLQHGFQLEKKDDWWSVTRVTQKECRPLTAFRDVPSTINDLIPLNFWVSQKPDIHFRHMIHLSKRNADGSIYSIDGKDFKIHTPEDTKIRGLNTVEELKTVLRDYFDMDPASIPLRETL